MSYYFNIDYPNIADDERVGALSDVPVGAVFVLHNKKYIKLCNDTTKNAIAVTVDPMFSVMASSRGKTTSLYYRIFAKLKDIGNAKHISAMWTPTEEEYVDYFSMFKDYFHDEWFVGFDDDNSEQDIEGEYLYADSAGCVKRDNADPRYSRDSMRTLAVRAFCSIDQNAEVVSKKNACDGNNRGGNTYELFSSRFWRM